MKKTTKRGKVSKNYNAVMATYKKNEDNNLHSENVVLLAKNVGTASDLTKAKAILAEHNKLGYISTDLLKKRDTLSKKLYAKLVNLTTPKKEDGGVMENPKTISKDSQQPNMFSEQSGIVDDTAEATGEKFAKGGGVVKEISFENSNLYLYGWGRDSNGNTIVKVGFPNQRAFSIQTNAVLNFTHDKRGYALSELSQDDVNKIEAEVVGYVKEHGSEAQKKNLKVYSSAKYAKGGSVDSDTKIIKDQRGNTLYLTKIDATHFFLSVDEDKKGNPYHIGQIRNEPYYYEVKDWLDSNTANISELRQGMAVYPMYGSYAGKKGYVAQVMPDQKTVEVLFKHKVGNEYVKFDGNELRTDLHYAKGGSVDVSIETPGTIEPAGKTETGVIKGEISGIPDMQPLEENVYAKGGSVESDSPKIYVASLEHYNNGKLVGKWFDFADYSDEGELAEAIQEYLDELGVEEYAVHDYENFPSSYYHEYMGKGDFAKIYAVYAPAEERGIPFNVLAEAASDLGYKDEPEKVAEDMYHGAYKDWKDFAYEVQEMGVNNPEYYFDYEALGSDERINASEEDEKEWGWDEMTDEEIGEQIVENYGGFSELPKKLTEMYFDYDKLVADLEYDYISVRGDDGLEYFFYRNYAKGGKVGGSSFGSAGTILPWLGI